MFKNRILARHHVFTFSELEQIPEFVHMIVGRPCVSNRVDAEPDREVAYLPPDEVLSDSRMNGFRLVHVRQIHSDRTIVLDRSGCRGQSLERADGIIVLEPEICPIIRTADCVPVIAVTGRPRALGVFHAGWRGTCSRVVEKGVKLLLQATGARPEELVVAIGPAIRRCCYEVGPEVEEEFRAEGHDTEKLFRSGYLDLIEANRSQLFGIGIARVLDSGCCTACHPELFYSYRRNRTASRMWTMGGFRAS